jgi:hypothetical protein
MSAAISCLVWAMLAIDNLGRAKPHPFSEWNDLVNRVEVQALRINMATIKHSLIIKVDQCKL